MLLYWKYLPWTFDELLPGLTGDKGANAVGASPANHIFVTVKENTVLTGSESTKYIFRIKMVVSKETKEYLL